MSTRLVTDAGFEHNEALDWTATVSLVALQKIRRGDVPEPDEIACLDNLRQDLQLLASGTSQFVDQYRRGDRAYAALGDSLPPSPAVERGRIFAGDPASFAAAAVDL